MSAEKNETAALAALRSRGIDNAEELLTYARPEAILETCRWFDQRTGVGPGLLAKKIRDGGVSIEDPITLPKDQKLREMQERFGELVEGLEMGTPAESHRRLAHRRKDENADDCAGTMVVDDGPRFPVVSATCDVCGLNVGYTFRMLKELPPAASRERFTSRKSG